MYVSLVMAVFGLVFRLVEEALCDLNAAVKMAPLGRDVRKILLKAKEDTENCYRPSQAHVHALMETSTDTIHDSISSGVGSSLASSE